ncbi:hypothetical protein GCM10018773_60370 [Streptomyces candidus]|nr:hypothetical protein GCM10018773_60370 [Streptomyces candidus]
MSSADRRKWAAACTLLDLSHLTAAWLEGTIQSQPGYQPRYGPDDETLPYVPVLASVNRAGFLTGFSQPGLTSADGTWLQAAAVEGVVADSALLEQLTESARRAGLQVILSNLRDGGEDYGPGVVVTFRDGDPFTRVGRALSLQDLDVLWHGVPVARDIVARARQVTVIEPDFGPSTRLWDVLAEAAAHPVGR